MKGNRIEFSFKDGEFHPEGKFNDFELDEGVKDDTLILRRRVKGIEPSLRDVLNEHDMQVAGSPPQNLLPEDGDAASETPPPVPDSEPTREVHELKQIINGMEAERQGDRVVRADLEKRLKDAFAQRDAADAFLMKHVDVFNLVKAVDADVQKQHPEFKGEKPVDRVYEYLKWFTSLGATIDELRAKAQEYLSTKARLEQVMSDLKTEKDERGKAEEARGNAESAYRELNGNLILLRGELSPLASQIKELAGGAIDAEDPLDILEQAVPLIESNKLMLGADASKVAEIEQAVAQYKQLETNHKDLEKKLKTVSEEHTAEVQRLTAAIDAEQIRNRTDKSSYELKEAELKGKMDSAGRNLESVRAGYEKDKASLQSRIDALEAAGKKPDEIAKMYEDKVKKLQEENKALELSVVCGEENQKENLVMCAKIIAKEKAKLREEHALALEDVRKTYDSEVAKYQSEIEGLKAGGAKPADDCKVKELEEIIAAQKENYGKLALESQASHERQLKEAEERANKDRESMLANIKAQGRAIETQRKAIESQRKTYDSEIAKYEAEIAGLKAGGAKPADDSQVKALEAKVSSLEDARKADETKLRQALARKDVQREHMETDYRKQLARKDQELLESREELQSARRDFASAPANLVAIIQNWTGKKTSAVSVKPSKRLPVVLNSLYNAYETRFGKDSEQSDALAEVRDVMLGSGSHEKKTGRLADVVTSYSSVFAKQNARTALSAFINAYLLSLNPEKFAKKHAKEYRIINGLRSGVPFGRVAELQAENSSLEWDAVNVKQQNEALEQAAVELRDSYLEARRYNNVLAANEFYQGNYKKAIGLFSRAARLAPYEEQKNDVKMNIAITCLELAEKEKDEKKKARLCSRAQSCLNRQAPDDQLRIEYQKMCYELKSSLTAA